MEEGGQASAVTHPNVGVEVEKLYHDEEEAYHYQKRFEVLPVPRVHPVQEPPENT